MGTKWQRFTVEIPKGIGPAEREILGDEILDFIRERIQNKNLDRNNEAFAAYSKAYAESLEFKIAGKSKGDRNMTLSGDTLGAMKVLSHTNGKITMGFENGSKENAIADGNIRGTYGHSSQVGPKREFLGITKKDLERIVEKFDPEAAAIAARANREVSGE